MDRNKITGDNIRHFRKAKGMTLFEMESLVGITASTISKYERNKLPITTRVVEKIAKALGVSPATLIGWELEDDDALGTDTVEVDNLGAVAGGIPVDAIEDRCNKFSITEALARTGQFATFEIKGDSMSPKINDGDTVLVKYQPMVDSGDVAIIYMNDFQVTCKKVFFLNDGKVKVQAYNEEVYGTKVYTKAELKEMNFRILGKVILVVRDNF